MWRDANQRRRSEETVDGLRPASSCQVPERERGVRTAVDHPGHPRDSRLGNSSGDPFRGGDTPDASLCVSNSPFSRCIQG